MKRSSRERGEAGRIQANGGVVVPGRVVVFDRISGREERPGGLSLAP